jgi:metal-responsive CopG/Arc/MetJ family transcriptional regulator
VATINFSVPDDIKEAFQETFAKENRSAIIARLMQEAVEERKRQERRAAAINALLDLGEKKGRSISEREIARARRAGRP